MSLKFNVDAKELASVFDNLKDQVERDITLSVQALAASTYSSVVEMAQQELVTSRKTYLDALDFQEIEDKVWVVSLDLDKAGFLEEGMEPHDMHETHLKKNFKVSKEGYKYKSIPFDHGKNPTDMNSKQKELSDQIRAALKKLDIPFKEIETNQDGSPRIGKLHSMNLPSALPSAAASHPALHGLSIYQSKDPSGNIRRDIMTFRTISENPTNAAKWQHPGVTAKHFFEKAFAKAEVEWETEILPSIFAKYGK